MNHHWSSESVFYHIYPLGYCGAEHENDGSLAVTNRLHAIIDVLDDLVELGITAIYLGPVFESSSHGYDTTNYFQVDRRLGQNHDLKRLSEEIHLRGMRLVLDGVFNHVGRRFWAFEDVNQNRELSAYTGWFVDLNFHASNRYNDNFSYACWEGHASLPRLNLHNDSVTKHLLDAVGYWIDEFDIDGLRLDAADCVLPSFWQQLRQFTRQRKPEFWLMGEIIHGDYRKWANHEQFDSVTNYEAYKGIWSSLNDRNFWEIAYTFNRQSGPEGIYTDLPLYNFVDNHDVERIASILIHPAHLSLAYVLMFTMPGIPSIYYGSELGWAGKKAAGDWGLRLPMPAVAEYRHQREQSSVSQLIRHLALTCRNIPALRHGTYHQVHVSSEQLAFARMDGDQWVLVVLNMNSDPVEINIQLPTGTNGTWFDQLNGEDLGIRSENSVVQIPGNWARIITIKR